MTHSWEFHRSRSASIDIYTCNVMYADIVMLYSQHRALEGCLRGCKDRGFVIHVVYISGKLCLGRKFTPNHTFGNSSKGFDIFEY